MAEIIFESLLVICIAPFLSLPRLDGFLGQSRVETVRVRAANDWKQIKIKAKLKYHLLALIQISTRSIRCGEHIASVDNSHIFESSLQQVISR